MIPAAAVLLSVPVLIELFTSEGCSSCPPADQLLRKVRVEQPVEGVTLITLSEHVDYWDYIGWKDPNATPAFTARQRVYANHFASRGAYTPQMVVDGEWEFVGSDARALKNAIQQAAKRPKLAVRLELHLRTLKIAADGPPPPPDAEWIVALTQNNVASAVSRGENQGHRLEHDSVVRHWQTLKGKAQSTAEAALPDLPGVDTAVVFLQDRRSRRVLGAASLSLR